MRKPPSLRAQAITWLSQREHSERELRTKLLRRLQAIERRAASGRAYKTSLSVDSCAGSTWNAPEASEVPESAKLPEAPEAADRGQGKEGHTAQVDGLVVWLLERGYLDDQRFVASRIHVRADRFGVARIARELSHHGLDLPPDAVDTLRSTEFARAVTIWQRRFGSPPADIREAARQARFLVGRGFSGDVVRRVIPRLRATVDSDQEDD